MHIARRDAEHKVQQDAGRLVVLDREEHAREEDGAAEVRAPHHHLVALPAHRDVPGFGTGGRDD
eukprot:10754637-Lingulodinium_polyedra.AAC.1